MLTLQAGHTATRWSSNDHKLGLRSPSIASRQTARATAPSLSKPVPWTPVAAGLAIAGATGGPLLDGLHSRIPLQVYDVLPFSVAGLNSSLLVPPILASLYITIGGASIIADKALASNEATSAAVERVTLPYVIGNGAILALLTHTSALLHGAEVPTPTIGAILAALTVINWTYFDRTVHGALLGVLLAVGAPLTEVVLNALFGLWHYPREDLPGMVSWVPWCYAFYVPYLSNLSRYFWQTSAEASDLDA